MDLRPDTGSLQAIFSRYTKDKRTRYKFIENAGGGDRQKRIGLGIRNNLTRPLLIALTALNLKLPYSIKYNSGVENMCKVIEKDKLFDF